MSLICPFYNSKVDYIAMYHHQANILINDNIDRAILANKQAIQASERASEQACIHSNANEPFGWDDHNTLNMDKTQHWGYKIPL